MCLGQEGGGVDREVNQDCFTMDLVCGLVTGMQRRGDLTGLGARMAL